MFSTYQLMRNYCGNTLDKYSLSYLVRLFKSATDKRGRNKYFSAIFCKVYPYILETSKKFIYLQDEQKVELTLLNLYTALNNYDCNSSAEFFTYFHKSLHNKLLSYDERQKSGQKNQAWNNLIDMSDDSYEYTINSVESKDATELYNKLLLDIETSNVLNLEEKLYCKAIMLGANTADDIIRYTGMSCRKRTSKRKLTYPMSDSSAKRIITSIRDSIREKVKVNGGLY